MSSIYQSDSTGDSLLASGELAIAATNNQGMTDASSSSSSSSAALIVPMSFAPFSASQCIGSHSTASTFQLESIGFSFKNGEVQAQSASDFLRSDGVEEYVKLMAMHLDGVELSRTRINIYSRMIYLRFMEQLRISNPEASEHANRYVAFQNARDLLTKHFATNVATTQMQQMRRLEQVFHTMDDCQWWLHRLEHLNSSHAAYNRMCDIAAIKPLCIPQKQIKFFHLNMNIIVEGLAIGNTTFRAFLTKIDFGARSIEHHGLAVSLWEQGISTVVCKLYGRDSELGIDEQVLLEKWKACATDTQSLQTIAMKEPSSSSSPSSTSSPPSSSIIARAASDETRCESPHTGCSDDEDQDSSDMVDAQSSTSSPSLSPASISPLDLAGRDFVATIPLPLDSMIRDMKRQQEEPFVTPVSAPDEKQAEPDAFASEDDMSETGDESDAEPDEGRSSHHDHNTSQSRQTRTRSARLKSEELVSPSNANQTRDRRVRAASSSAAQVDVEPAASHSRSRPRLLVARASRSSTLTAVAAHQPSTESAAIAASPASTAKRKRRIDSPPSASQPEPAAIVQAETGVAIHDQDDGRRLCASGAARDRAALVPRVHLMSSLATSLPYSEPIRIQLNDHPMLIIVPHLLDQVRMMGAINLDPRIDPTSSSCYVGLTRSSLAVRNIPLLVSHGADSRSMEPPARRRTPAEVVALMSCALDMSYAEDDAPIPSESDASSSDGSKSSRNFYIEGSYEHAEASSHQSNVGHLSSNSDFGSESSCAQSSSSSSSQPARFLPGLTFNERGHSHNQLYPNAHEPETCTGKECSGCDPIRSLVHDDKTRPVSFCHAETTAAEMKVNHGRKTFDHVPFFVESGPDSPHDSPLRLDRFFSHPHSLARLLPAHGDADPTHAFGGCLAASVSVSFSSAPMPAHFNLRVEPNGFGFYHHQLTGSSTWIVIPPKEKPRVLEVYKRLIANRQRRGSIAAQSAESMDAIAHLMYYSRKTFIPLGLLKEAKIHHEYVQVDAGTIVVGRGDVMRCGFDNSAGTATSYSCNTVDAGWLRRGSGAGSHEYGAAFITAHFKWVLSIQELSRKHVDLLAPFDLIPEDIAQAIDQCPPRATCLLLRNIKADIQARQVARSNGGAIDAMSDVDWTASVAYDEDHRYCLSRWMANIGDELGVIASIDEALVAIHAVSAAFMSEYYLNSTKGRVMCFYPDCSFGHLVIAPSKKHRACRQHQ